MARTEHYGVSLPVIVATTLLRHGQAEGQWSLRVHRRGKANQPQGREFSVVFYLHLRLHAPSLTVTLNLQPGVKVIFFLTDSSNYSDLDQISLLVDAGQLKPVIQQVRGDFAERKQQLRL